MDQVDGKTLLTEPEQESVGKMFLGRRGEIDGHDDQVDTDGSVTLADVDVGREDVLGRFVHVLRPGSPFGMGSGVGTDQETRDTTDGGDDSARPFVTFEEFLEGGFVGEVTEEHAVDGLDLEGFCNVGLVPILFVRAGEFSTYRCPLWRPGGSKESWRCRFRCDSGT